MSFRLAKRVVACLLAPVAFLAAGSTARAAVKIGDAAPPITVLQLKGSPVSLPAEARGKVVVVHFWASWCSSCVAEMKALESLYQTYKADGFIPYSIDVSEPRQRAEEYVRPLGLTYPVVLDSDGTGAKAYGVSGIPMTFVLDRSGTIRFKILGEITREGLRKLLRTLF